MEKSAQDSISVHRIKFDQCSYYKQILHRYKALNPRIGFGMMIFRRIVRFVAIKKMPKKSFINFCRTPEKTVRFHLPFILYYYG